MRASGRFRVAIIGAGPRGLATAARIIDRAADRLDVHLIDPVPGGKVWRTDQDPVLLMNSRLQQATLFADESTPGVEGARGPSFNVWCRDIAPALDLPECFLDELSRLGPNGFGSRALFGHYAQWVLKQLTERGVSVHPREALSIRRRTGGDDQGVPGQHLVSLDDGTELAVDAVVLALGHLPVEPADREAGFARFAHDHGLAYLPPGPATEARLEQISPGEEVAVLGAGLNFYDIMALLTLGRGGSFSRDASGLMTYRPSGSEPVLLVGSSRGVPYLARADEPQPPGLDVITARIRADWLSRRGTLDFGEEVWPHIVRELRCAWYQAALPASDPERNQLLRLRTDEPAALARDLLSLPAEGPEVDRWCTSNFPGIEPFDLDLICDPLRADPLGGPRRSDSLRGVLAHDLEAAQRVPRGPLPAVGERLAAVKDIVRDLVAAGSLKPESVLDDLNGWFRSIGGFIAAGPPSIRVQQLVALMDAGLVRSLGRSAKVRADPETGMFVVASDSLPRPRPVRGVIEARLPEEDLRRTTSPLVRHILATGTGRTATLGDGNGSSRRQTGGLDVTRGDDPNPCRVISSDGRASNAIFALGLPVQPLEWNIANLPQPGKNARTLSQADLIAQQLLTLASASHAGSRASLS